MAAEEPAQTRLRGVEEETRQFQKQLAEQGVTVELPGDQPVDVGLRQLDQAVLHEIERRTRQRDNAQAYAESIVETMREPLLMLNPDLHIVGANRAFYQFFHLSADELLGRSLYDVDGKRWVLPELLTLFTDVLANNGEVSALARIIHEKSKWSAPCRNV